MPAPRALVPRRLAALTMLLVAASVGCRGQAPPPVSTTAPVDVTRLYVLLLNGGGTPSQNYQSHLLHVQQLDAMLQRIGVPREHVTVLSSDGADPGLDLATRDAQPEPDFWLLEGSRLEAPLRTPVTFADSRVPGAVVAPATVDELRRFFARAGETLRPGDTLFVYVTDHGTRAPKDKGPLDTAITLWGEGQHVTVRELGEMLRALDPGVRVVTVMSQCFSGGFAALSVARADDVLPDGATCGFFSSTYDRPAYGCYPENRGRDNVGHSFHFLDGLAQSGRFLEAHRGTLVHDASPDVPLRTSDVWLEQRLKRAAQESGQDLDTLVDGLLREAWRDQGAWEADVRLLDRIGQAYGFFSPRSMAEVKDQSSRLEAMREQLKTHHAAWDRALDSARRANLERFVTRRPPWRERLAEPALREIRQPQSRRLTTELLAALGPDTRADRAMSGRLGTLRTKAETAQEVSYRMDVRQGVLLRMRATLISVAGRTYLRTAGTPEERRAFDAVVACEDLAIPAPGVAPGAELAKPEPFPSLQDDLALADDVLPAWMGIQFEAASETRRAKGGLQPGAAAVLAVYPNSPAAAAGLRSGDVVIGPPDAPFVEREQVREWTMLSAVDAPRPLDVLRDGERIRVTLVPKAMPGRWPKPPGPPAAGTPAPPLELGRYRGAAPTTLADGKPHLLFFWATWCGICKLALPEVDAFARERGTSVVAITDEDREKLDAFFGKHQGPFPSIVATDDERRAFASYGVSGLPTFVLVGGDGKVVATATGYDPAKGLPLDGWVWSARPAVAPHG